MLYDEEAVISTQFEEDSLIVQPSFCITFGFSVNESEFYWNSSSPGEGPQKFMLVRNVLEENMLVQWV